jgi:hypothetical protein
MVSARSRSRVTGSRSCFCGSLESLRQAFIRALARSIRSLAKSRTAVSTGGHSFSCSELSFKPALTAAIRASAKAARSSALMYVWPWDHRLCWA